MGAMQKLQNSIQTVIIFLLVYPIHTNSLIWVTFVELLFCHFPPPNNSIRGKDSQIYLIFHLNIFVFQTNGKQPYSFPVLSRFWNGLCWCPSVVHQSQAAQALSTSHTKNTIWDRIIRVYKGFSTRYPWR